MCSPVTYRGSMASRQRYRRGGGRRRCRTLSVVRVHARVYVSRVHPNPRRRLPRPLFVFGLIAVTAVACDRSSELPDPATPEYEEAVRTLYRGVAAVQVGETGVAEASFRRLTELAPGEAAGWANLGVVALLRNEPDSAAGPLQRARELAPGDPRIRLAAAVVAQERGDLAGAAEALRESTQADADPRALYLLAQITEREEGAGGVTGARRLIDRLLAVRPGNRAALLEAARLSARARDGDALGAALDSLRTRLDAIPPPLEAAFDAVRAAAVEEDFATAGTELAFLRTEIEALPAYRRDQEALVLSAPRTELLIDRFLRLAPPVARAAPPDTGIRFAPEPLELGAGPSTWVRTLWIDETAPLAMIAGKTDGDHVWVGADPDRPGETFSVGDGAANVPLAGFETLDFDYDFRTDIALAGPGGLRLLRQVDGGFSDVTAGAVPVRVAASAHAGAWAADLDMEGDMDLVVAPVDGPPLLLINRGDGGFDARPGFESVRRLRGFAWGDLDADGDPDAALLDTDGRLHVFLNARQAVPPFRPIAPPEGPERLLALGLTDLDRDARMDLLGLDAGGDIWLMTLELPDAPAAGAAPAGTDREEGAPRWRVRRVAQWPDFPPTEVGEARLFPVDIDNNGDVDLVASTSASTLVWLATADGLAPHRSLDFRTTDVADISGEGRLDLLGVAGDGAASWLANQGTRDYFATVIRPRAAGATGDRRINPFGIGGEVEVRAGLLYRKQPIRSAGVHFGLGEQPQVDVARILWPNGTVQAEFNLSASNVSAFAQQRLKGSCPWVFAWDGEAMSFVTDFLWRTALGLRINAQGDAAVIHSEDWIRIPGHRLRPRDGFYDIRITAELWESHFFDHVALMVVDHPAGTEALVDERFTLPPPELEVEITEPLRPVARAVDHRGRDVSRRVLALDEVYLDTFERGPYQGVAEDHWVEVELGDDVPAGSLRLVASGWIYPTDSSINVALAQGGHPAPRGLSLEIPDGRGGWAAVRPDLGFPAGKTKTIVIDLDGVFAPGAERRLRLRTNLEIYWDRIGWTVALPDAAVRTRRLLPASADLRYRGFSEVRQAGRTAPELPEYDRIAATAPLWRDLVGYHTGFGDVRALNETVDDRYVIMNAGDELALRFPAPPPPPDGWTRDFVLVGDGWVKDGDYNTGFSTTVLPLPYHGMTDYADAPGRLEDDPAYRRHPEDWKLYHTRYVNPRDFHNALVPRRD